MNAARPETRDQRPQGALLRTASGKEQKLVDFIDQLDREGLTVGDLARRARVGRSHLEQMLHGRRSGRQSWKHVIPLLSNAALFHLKQCSAWNTYAAAAEREAAEDDGVLIAKARKGEGAKEL